MHKQINDFHSNAKYPAFCERKDVWFWMNYFSMHTFTEIDLAPNNKACVPNDALYTMPGINTLGPAECSSNLPQHTWFDVSSIQARPWLAASGVFD